MASRGLALQAYLAAVRGPAPEDAAATPPPERPEGPVVLAWARGTERGRALASLCARLRNLQPEIAVFACGETTALEGMQALDLPGERPAECAVFARALRPDVVLWAGRELRPALLSALSNEGARLIALDLADEPLLTPRAPRWLPDPGPATLALFDSLYTVGSAAARRVRRLGVDAASVHEASALLDTDPPLTCSDAEHEEVAALLAGRPAWLAARVRAEEAADVFAAQRMAVRLNHRLLLVLVPADAEAARAILRSAKLAQLRLCHWDAGEALDEITQVLLTEGPEDLGLWYRIAPLAFVGGSLANGVGGEDPYEAAALGAAILYGPNVGRHLVAYSRLVEAGAARIVRDADSLAAAVLNTVAPDQAATMAHAGWDVISSGADLVDRVIAEVSETLDARHGGQA